MAFVVPAPARAQVPDAVCAFLGIATGAGTAAVAAGTALGLAGLAVPTYNVVSDPANAVTAAQTTGDITKKCADAIATMVLKTIIVLVRDMVMRWIITGRFEGPVFSTSFSIDAAKTAENASRIFLSGLTRINFCQFIGPPSIRSFIIAKDFTLSCTLPNGLDRRYTATLLTLATNPRALSLEEREALTDPQNMAPDNFIQLADEREKSITRAIYSLGQEFTAGQGFLGIRDEKTGRIITPGSYVGELVKQTGIGGPTVAAATAQTVQQAVNAIIETAIRVVIEKGLTKAFGSGR